MPQGENQHTHGARKYLLLSIRLCPPFNQLQKQNSNLKNYDEIEHTKTDEIEHTKTEEFVDVAK